MRSFTELKAIPPGMAVSHAAEISALRRDMCRKIFDHSDNDLSLDTAKKMFSSALLNGYGSN